MLAGVSTRKYKVVGEPVGEDVEQRATATGKSTGINEALPTGQLGRILPAIAERTGQSLARLDGIMPNWRGEHG